MDWIFDPRKRVLIVEDDRQMRLQLELILRRLDNGLVIDCMPSAEAALELVRRGCRNGASPYRTILIDVRLAGPMSGIELWRILRKECATASFAFMSGMAPEQFLVETERTSSRSPIFLRKPFAMRDCRDILRRLLVERGY
jgi:DNA-binding NtrC family response regulator